MVLAHAGRTIAPHDLWVAWSFDPLLLGTLILAGWAYARGGSAFRRNTEVWRSRCFAAALVVLAFAVLSPLDALAHALASAHMVQHVLILLVAAPLLALSAPWARVIRGMPARLRRVSRKLSGRLHASAWLRTLRLPTVIWTAHVAVIWTWHASVPYDAALRHDLVHMLEHASFFITGVLFWTVVVGGRHPRSVSHGHGILLLFAMAMQSVFLSALLTFAETPWYRSYTASTKVWGLDPLADQQLAGVIMWVPAGAVYLLAALALLAHWIRTPATGPDRASPDFAGATFSALETQSYPRGTVATQTAGRPPDVAG